MTPNESDGKLARALHDAVADIEPRDALAEIRSRTRPGRERRGWPLVLAGAVATAAIVATFAVISSGSGDPTPGPAASETSTSPEPTPSPPPPDEVPVPGEGSRAVPVYYIGDTERAGPRLYREFQSLPGNPFEAAIAALTGTPLDPDYRTAWPEGSILNVSFDGIGADGFFGVRLSDPSFAERPPGMSEAEAEAAVQQVVYTLQAGAQTRAKVFFSVGSDNDKQPLDTVYGVDTSEPLANAPIMDALSHMSITTPEHGSTVADELLLTGVANGFEGTVSYRILRADDVVDQGAGIADGAYEKKLFPFSIPIDVSDLSPGDYTVWASTDDPSDGEGIGAFTDSKQFTIE